jgi:hypothetical protein
MRPEYHQAGCVTMPDSFHRGDPRELPEPAADGISAAISPIKQTCRIT